MERREGYELVRNHVLLDLYIGSVINELRIQVMSNWCRLTRGPSSSGFWVGSGLLW